jgi:DNA-binding transcriptional LysR family regulator
LSATAAFIAAMNLHHLELFYYVCRHGGISRAVRHIPYGIQQPAVSSQVLLLEEDLGTKLFDRQPFRLTPDGQELYDFIRPFFDNVDGVGAHLRSKRAPKMRIAASEIVLRDYLPTIITSMKKSQPALRFALKSGYQAEMERWLYDGDIDVAITPLEMRPHAGLKFEPIVTLPLALVVPKHSPLRHAKELWAQDRIDESLICVPPSESICRTFQKGLKRLHVTWPVSIEASSTTLITQYVANGYGYGVTVNVPTVVTHPKVRALPLDGFDPVEIVALWHPPQSPLVTALIAAIRARAGELWPRR